MTEKSFCTTHEAAELLGVTPRTVQLWCESGVLDSRRTSGGHRRIPRDALDRLRTEQQGQPAPVAQPPSLPRRLRILVVEDEPALLRLYRLRLSAWAIAPEVTTLNDGFEALVWIGSHKPDLLIADLHMPEWDGFGMLRTVRRIASLDRMEIVVVTGLDAETVAERGGLPEDVRILPKPIPFGELEQIATELARSLEGVAPPV